VAGDAAELFDPLDVDDIAAAISRVLEQPELAAGLVERGRERCRRLTWEATAKATLASYRRALDAKRSRRN
jgi:glycosyltransferase involved in cell wall biosynthesis